MCQTRLVWMVLVSLLAPVLVSGCYKVHHLGKSTSGQTFDRVFTAQTKTGSARGAWTHKPMEAELGKVAATQMVKPKKSSSTRQIGVPLMTMSQ